MLTFIKKKYTNCAWQMHQCSTAKGLFLKQSVFYNQKLRAHPQWESNPRSSGDLTHWGWDKMAAIFQKTFSNAFSWMKMNELRLRFHWNLFPRVELTIFQESLAQIMAWRRPGDKPLSEAMVVSLPTYICVTRPQWVNKSASPQGQGNSTFNFMIWNTSLFYLCRYFFL